MSFQCQRQKAALRFYDHICFMTELASSGASKPLRGIRVLDLTRVASGPFATMQLGDLGADVIKIEEPSLGDESRRYGPPFIGVESAYFLSVNRNKRSCAIDLKTPEGQALIFSMAGLCDVVIENFRPGTQEKLGVSYEDLKQNNPELIYCSITGFGASGPDAKRPGYDLILQGESGVMGITGEKDGSPMKVGTSVADMVSGLYAAQGILAAIVERKSTGRGSRLNISMLDSLASLLTFNAGIYFATGESPTRRGNEHPTICPYETFEVKDGWLNLGLANDKFWELFCERVGSSKLSNDSRFRSAPERVRHATELRPLVAEILRDESRDHWIEVLGSVGIPCGAIRTVQEVCESEQMTSRNMIITMEHATLGPVRNIDTPIRIDDPEPRHVIAPPVLGGDTRQVLEELLELSPAEIELLEEKGVIRCG